MTWDSCSKQIGGTEIAAWEALLEFEKFDLQAGENEQGGVSLIVDIANSLWEIVIGGGLELGHEVLLLTKKIAHSVWLFRSTKDAEV